MSTVKITKIGNSQGFTIPKELMEKGNFSIGDILEATVFNEKIILFKKPLHHSQMTFEDSDDDIDKEWIDADLGELDNE